MNQLCIVYISFCADNMSTIGLSHSASNLVIPERLCSFYSKDRRSWSQHDIVNNATSTIPGTRCTLLVFLCIIRRYYWNYHPQHINLTLWKSMSTPSEWEGSDVCSTSLQPEENECETDKASSEQSRALSLA